MLIFCSQRPTTDKGLRAATGTRERRRGRKLTSGDGDVNSQITIDSGFGLFAEVDARDGQLPVAPQGPRGVDAKEEFQKPIPLSRIALCYLAISCSRAKILTTSVVLTLSSFPRYLFKIGRI